MGIDNTVASGMMGMMVFFTVPSRFLGGVISDRVRKGYMKLLLAGAYFLLAVGITIFLLRQSMTTVYILLILFGFSSGALTPLLIVIVGRYFGRKGFGSIFGTCLAFQSPVSFLAPVYVGWVYDTTGSYITALILFTAMAAFTGFLVCFAHPPQAPDFESQY